MSNKRDISTTGTGATDGVSAFERITHEDEAGEYWLARELSRLLGYDEWRNFLGVIHEAMEVCRVQGGTTEGFFVAISKTPRSAVAARAPSMTIA